MSGSPGVAAGIPSAPNRRTARDFPRGGSHAGFEAPSLGHCVGLSRGNSRFCAVADPTVFRFIERPRRGRGHRAAPGPAGALRSHHDDGDLALVHGDPAAVQARGYSPHQIIALTSDLVVPGQSTFYWNGAGSVVSEGGGCYINPGIPSFE